MGAVLFRVVLLGALLAAVVLLLRSGDDAPTPVAEVEIPRLYTNNYVSAWLAQQLSGAAAVVIYPTPAGTEPDFVLATAEDSTSWLDMEQLRLYVENVTATLEARGTVNRTVLYWQRDELLVKLGQIDAGLLEVGAALAGAPLLYTDSAYEVLAQRYAFNGITLPLRADQALSSDELAVLDQLLAAHPAAAMLWPQPPAELIQQQLAARGVTAVVFRTLQQAPPFGDFETEMAAGIARLKRYLAR